LDTAAVYDGLAMLNLHGAEQVLEEVGASKEFVISTKAVVNKPEYKHNLDGLTRSLKESLDTLGVEKVYIFYFHGPDRTTPVEEQLEAVDTLYKQGLFERFGISNHTTEEIEKFIKIAKDRNFIAPSVYQGQYNLVVRGAEKEIIPTCRKHGISFYAYR